MIPLAVGRIKASRRRRATYRFSAHVGAEAETASAGKRESPILDVLDEAVTSTREVIDLSFDRRTISLLDLPSRTFW